MRRRLEEFEKAFYRLMKAVNKAQSELEIDGVIQRFEFTFELAWKALQEHLREEGIICNSPRRCLKEAYKVGLIEDEKVWLKILEDRNLSVHTYDFSTSRAIFEKIKTLYLDAFEKLLQRLKEY